MSKLIIFSLLAARFLLSSYGKAQQSTDAIDSEATQLMCVHRYDASTDTISIYFDTTYNFVPEIQHISELTNSTADQTMKL